jgi:putative membrane protein insertion efficiency factor
VHRPVRSRTLATRYDRIPADRIGSGAESDPATGARMLSAETQANVSGGDRFDRDCAGWRWSAQEPGDRGRAATSGIQPGRATRAAATLMAPITITRKSAPIRFARGAAVILIDLYRAVLSPILTASIGPACRFEPTCSEYAREAISRHGIVFGGYLAMGRLARCRPFGGSGHDPVPQDHAVRASS